MDSKEVPEVAERCNISLSGFRSNLLSQLQDSSHSFLSQQSGSSNLQNVRIFSSSPNAAAEAVARHLRAFTSMRNSEQVFTVFNLLPLEIRRHIWGLAQPGPQFVELRCGCDPMTEVRLSALLYVNRESRGETLRTLVPVLEGEKGYRELGALYINLAVDTLLLCFRYAHEEPYMDNILAGINDNVFVGLKHLVIDLSLWESVYENIEIDSSNPLLKFRNLEKVTLLIKGRTRGAGNISLFAPFGTVVMCPPPPHLSSEKFILEYQSHRERCNDWTTNRIDLATDVALGLDLVTGFDEGLEQHEADRMRELRSILFDMQLHLDALAGVDSSWKVPEIDIKCLQRGETFSG